MFEIPPQENSYKFFQLDWDISKNKANEIENEIRHRRKTLNMLQKDLNVNVKFEESSEKGNFSKKNNHNVEMGTTNPVDL